MYHGPLTPDYCGSVVAMYGLYDGVFMYIEPSGNGAGVGSDSLCHLNCVCHHAAVMPPTPGVLCHQPSTPSNLHEDG